MDRNGDHIVEINDFVDRLDDLRMPGVTSRELQEVFEELDQNHDQVLTFNEFALYLEGAKRSPS
jgi:Ca2+-binding EF-hand superfamily protein